MIKNANRGRRLGERAEAEMTALGLDSRNVRHVKLYGSISKIISVSDRTWRLASKLRAFRAKEGRSQT
jgi:hypothetical protein